MPFKSKDLDKPGRNSGWETESSTRSKRAKPTPEPTLPGKITAIGQSQMRSEKKPPSDGSPPPTGRGWSTPEPPAPRTRRINDGGRSNNR